MRAPRFFACSSSSTTRMPEPSPATNPSRSLSNGREAFSGASLRSLRARAALAQRTVRREPGVDERELRGGEAELDEEVVAPRFLLVHEGGGVESLHLSGETAGQVLGVEAGDRPDSALAGDRRLPRLLGA